MIYIFYENGKLYYELPNGEITTERPEIFEE